MPLPRPTIGQLIWWAWAVWAAAIMISGFDPTHSDFHAFHETGRAWRGLPSHDPEITPNLNPPTWLPVVWAISFMPVRTAFWVWTAIGAASIVASVRLIVRARAVPVARLYWVAGALVLCMPFTQVWVLGQVTWLLLYPMTRAWLESESAPVRAGLWLAVVVLLKPPFALAAALLPFPIALTTALTGLLGTLVGIAWFGWAPWAAWLDQAHVVTWLTYPLNASLWGWTSRVLLGVHSSAGLASLPIAAVVAIVLVGLGLAIVVLRERRPPERWILAILWSLLMSPLGWIYYLPLALGPFLVCWRDTWTTRIALALLVIPLPMLMESSWPITTWSVYAFAVLLIGLAYWPDRSGHQAGAAGELEGLDRRAP